MKVALELQPCCGKRSGIGVYTYELARRIRDQDNLIFCGNLFNFLGRNDNSAALKDIAMPIRVSRLFPYGVYRRVWNKVPISYQSLFKDKTDMTVFFNYIVPPRVSGKVITTVYDMTYLRCPETMDAKNHKRLREGMKYSIERSDHILTISEFSRREIVELLNIPEERVSVVPCAPSLSDERVQFEACAARHMIVNPYLLYVGTIEPRKNLVRLIRAFARLKREQRIPHQLVLAGGKGWANEEIYETAACMEDVVFTGYLSDGEKYAMYENAAAFVFPSIYEGFGIPPLEAMAFGCPVVCSNAASLPEVVGAAAELVNPLDEVSISQGIWNVLSNESYAAELTRRGYRQINKFTWDASADKLTEICKTVLGVS